MLQFPSGTALAKPVDSLPSVRCSSPHSLPLPPRPRPSSSRRSPRRSSFASVARRGRGGALRRGRRRPGGSPRARRRGSSHLPRSAVLLTRRADSATLPSPTSASVQIRSTRPSGTQRLARTACCQSRRARRSMRRPSASAPRRPSAAACSSLEWTRHPRTPSRSSCSGRSFRSPSTPCRGPSSARSRRPAPIRSCPPQRPQCRRPRCPCPAAPLRRRTRRSVHAGFPRGARRNRRCAAATVPRCGWRPNRG